MANRSPFDSAVEKGRNAFLAGKSSDACPYRDKRKWDGRLTFSRAWQKAWDDGYEQAFNETIEQIVNGTSITIGSSSIGMDGIYLCATDPYGCDQYFDLPSKDNAKKALLWVISIESAKVGDHPAERNYSLR